MSDLIQETDHVGVALSHLLHQFKNSTQLKEFFTAILAPLQTTETDVFALYTERWPDVAVGAQLDNLGAIVGQPREGRTDAVYRLWIQARILINRSTGLADDTLRLLALTTDGAENFLVEQPPAAYLVESFNLDVNQQGIFDLLMLVKPAGVHLHFTYSNFPLTEVFRYDTIDQGYDSGAVYAGDLSG